MFFTSLPHLPSSNRPDFARAIPEGVVFTVRLTPKASANRLGGLVESPDGVAMLKAYVTAAPEKGKANKALSALIAKSIGCPKTSVEVIAGHTSRNKTVRIAGDAMTLSKACEKLINSQ